MSVTKPKCNSNKANTFFDIDNAEEVREILVTEFIKNQVWRKEKLEELSKRTGIEAKSVYKWYWRSRKELKNGKKSIMDLSYGLFMQRLSSGRAPLIIF